MNTAFKSLFVATALVALTASTAHAQQEFLVADSSSSGMYAQMVKQMAKFCAQDGLTIKEVSPKGGATANLAALVNNEASAALLHSDVIFAMSQSDSAYRKLKTLIALYPEEIHVVALRNSGLKTGGRLGFGGKEVTFNSLSDLRGFKVGAAGGGVYTGRILQGTGAGFQVVEYDTGAEVLPALDNGQVQAVIFVGGAPLANVAQLDGNKYKLLSIGDSIANQVRNVYKAATINYPNLRSGAVQTLAPQALVLTRVYKTPTMQTPQRMFRQCFMAHLDEMKEIPGMHRKWQHVDENDHGTWEWYELPGDEAAPAPAAVPTKKARRK